MIIDWETNGYYEHRAKSSAAPSKCNAIQQQRAADSPCYVLTPLAMPPPGSSDTFAASTTRTPPFPSETSIMNDAVIRKDGHNAISQSFMTYTTHPFFGNDHSSITSALATATYGAIAKK